MLQLLEGGFATLQQGYFVAALVGHAGGEPADSKCAQVHHGVGGLLKSTSS